VATKTPKSSKTSKTTATSKAAAKKTAAKKAAPARGTADAESAASQKKAPKTPKTTKAATATAAKATPPKQSAARKTAAAEVAPARPAARGADAQKRASAATASSPTGKAAGKATDKPPGKATGKPPGKPPGKATMPASTQAPGQALGRASTRASTQDPAQESAAPRAAPARQAARADKPTDKPPGKPIGKAAAKNTSERAAPARATQRGPGSRKAAAPGTPVESAATVTTGAAAPVEARPAPSPEVSPEPARELRRPISEPTPESTSQSTPEPKIDARMEASMDAPPATKSQKMDTTAKEGAPPEEASPEAEGSSPMMKTAGPDEAGAAGDGAPGQALDQALEMTPGAPGATNEGGDGEGQNAAAAAAAAPEKRPVNVLRRPGAGKASRPARPSSRPSSSASWETYPEPLQSLVDIGRRVLGIDNLRPGQAEALTHVMNRRDVLAVMPTGSGKSLLYQLPSLKLEGLTVVVSPLIALIKDQIDKMLERGVPVCRFDSTITVRQRREFEALVQAPGGKLVFVTPERISEPEFRDFLRTGAGGRGVSLLVVDEAHCVSQWGHDFRPSYLTLRKVVEDLGRPQLLATTATAPPHVREDILFQLGMPEAEIVTTTFERPNLHFEVIALPSDEDKLKTLVTLLKKLPRPGVVYCATVKKVEELHEALQRHAIPVAHYHGRMGKKDRDAEQQRLMEGKDLVMIATNAFGLGVDKANIRYVLHYHVPGSLEAYAQEAGRGGRDGKPARCVLLFSPDDVAIQEYFLTGTYPSRRQVRAVYKALQAWSPSEEAPPTIANLALSSHVGVQRTRTVLSLLKDERFVVEREEGAFWLADDRPSEDVLHEKARQYEARRIADRQRLDALLAYVKTPSCRNQVILEYLGEPATPPCGRCDNCQRSRDAALAAAEQASRLEAKATAELDQEWSADSSGAREEEEIKPRRVIRHRVVRIDEPAAAPPSTSTSPSTGAEENANGGAEEVHRARAAASSSGGNGVTEHASRHERAEADGRPARRPVNGQMRLPLTAGALAAAQEAGALAVPGAPEAPVALEPAVAATAAVAEQPETHRHSDGARLPADDESDESEGYEDEDEEFEDEDEDEEFEDEESEFEDEDEEFEDEDEDEEFEDEEFEDEDEEFEDDDEDDDEDEDDEDYEDDDEEYDDEDFELIEKTAAALAEEGYESDTEITILARKRVEKPRAPQKGAEPQAESEADRAKRRRKRRRRRKKRSMLPPKSAFITPVLSKVDSDAPPTRGRRRKAGPVIEYVRGPMRINMTPVASATPNDVAPSHKKKKRRRRGDEPVYPGAAASSGNGATAVVLQDPESSRKRRRRRRRRKRGAGGRPATHEGPVAFFSTQWSPPAESGREEPGRRRRRRKRRGRNGRPGREGGRPPESQASPPPPPRPPPPSGE
jgi:ATP-dependent DNA helicase RecQ